MIKQSTLALDQDAWDLVLDISGNWALASAPYSIAQDVASAIKTFLGECWYDISLGLPYWRDIFGKYPPLSFVKQQMINAALTVPNVVTVVVIFDKVENRQLSGQVQITDTDGNQTQVGF